MTREVVLGADQGQVDGAEGQPPPLQGKAPEIATRQDALVQVFRPACATFPFTLPTPFGQKPPLLLYAPRVQVDLLPLDAGLALLRFWWVADLRH